jgi:hypothetical protein
VRSVCAVNITSARGYKLPGIPRLDPSVAQKSGGLSVVFGAMGPCARIFALVIYTWPLTIISSAGDSTDDFVLCLFASENFMGLTAANFVRHSFLCTMETRKSRFWV